MIITSRISLLAQLFSVFLIHWLQTQAPVDATPLCRIFDENENLVLCWKQGAPLKQPQYNNQMKRKRSTAEEERYRQLLVQRHINETLMSILNDKESMDDLIRALDAEYLLHGTRWAIVKNNDIPLSHERG